MQPVKQVIARSHRSHAFAPSMRPGTFLGGHPWVLRSSIVEPLQAIETGAEIDLMSPHGDFLGRGLYHPNSRIAVRLYSNSQSKRLDSEFFVERLIQAAKRREQTVDLANTNAFRLCFSEADQLSGLIVEQYGDYIVIQQTAAGLGSHLPAITQWLVEHYRPSGILLRVDEKTAAAESIQVTQALLHGSEPPEDFTIRENSLTWQIDLRKGQKTGYYLDQRENRREAARWSKGRVLDVCCFLGGFSLNIRKWGNADSILALDTSAKVIEQARHQMQLNALTNVDFEVGDCFDRMKELVQQRQLFDTVILDPPRLVSSRSQQEAGMRAYHRLNSFAMELLSPGGVLITCSCSGRVTRDDFRDMLLTASLSTGRSVQVLDQRGAAPDHPTLLNCPETDYLKCFICRVI